MQPSFLSLLMSQLFWEENIKSDPLIKCSTIHYDYFHYSWQKALLQYINRLTDMLLFSFHPAFSGLEEFNCWAQSGSVLIRILLVSKVIYVLSWIAQSNSDVERSRLWGTPHLFLWLPDIKSRCGRHRFKLKHSLSRQKWVETHFMDTTDFSIKLMLENVKKWYLRKSYMTTFI